MAHVGSPGLSLNTESPDYYCEQVSNSSVAAVLGVSLCLPLPSFSLSLLPLPSPTSKQLIAVSNKLDFPPLIYSVLERSKSSKLPLLFRQNTGNLLNVLHKFCKWLKSLFFPFGLSSSHLFLLRLITLFPP